MAISRRFLQPINLLNAESDPSTAIQGDIYYNTLSDVVKYYDGSQWNEVGAGTGVSVSESAPTATNTGEGWFKSSTSELFIWDGTYWVEATSTIQGETLPDQEGNSGKFLSTDGSDTSWQTVDALPDQTGNSGKYLTTDGSIASWDDVDAATLDGQSGSYYTGYADTAESDAISSANAYSDSLATNYDSSGSATTAESNANSYTDSAIYTHNSDTTDVHGIADTSELATKTYADSAASTAAASLVDSAPSTLDTLNELAAALGDDPNFATTVANSIAAKADDADLTSHENATTSVHGIADTSLLATTSYVDAAESDAVNTANSYSDSLASNYDASGSAATAEGNANSYTDSEISTHNLDTTNVHGIADTSLLATTSYVDTAESDAVTTANSYSDSLSANYDSFGSASAVASDLTDHENATTSVHGIANTADLATKDYADNAASTAAANLVDSAPSTLDTLNELAAALGDDPNFATTITNSIATKANDSDLTDHENATTSVHGIADTSLLATTSYVDTAESDAVATANAYSDSLATNYDPAGSASTAQSNAESYADSLASNYDPAGSASAVASDLTDHENATTSVHGIVDTSLLATTSYVDTAESDAVSTANSYADSLASNYDAAGSASAVASDLTDHENDTTNVHGIANTSQLATFAYVGSSATAALVAAESYTDTGISTHNSDTTNVHGIVDTSALATKTYADNAASTAAANLIDSAPGTLDTLNELAAALGDDPNFATTVSTALGNKQPLDADLTSIAGLSGTSGLLKKTAANTWSLDANSYLTGNQTITLSGDVSGSGTTSISVTVADDSHNHIIGNVDGLQTALNAKLDSSSYTAADVLTKIKTVDGSTSGLDADLLDGQHGSYYATDSAVVHLAGTETITGAKTFSSNVIASSTANWNYSNIDLKRPSTNTASPRFIGMMLDGDSNASTTIGDYCSIWGTYSGAPTTGSTSVALSGQMVFGAPSGFQWRTNGTQVMSMSTTGLTITGNLTVNGVEIGAAGSSVLYQSSEPASPEIGDIWVDSDEPIITLNSNDFMPKSGGTFVGAVSGILPTLSSHLATKEYVDNNLPEPVIPESGFSAFFLGGM